MAHWYLRIVCENLERAYSLAFFKWCLHWFLFQFVQAIMVHCCISVIMVLLLLNCGGVLTARAIYLLDYAISCSHLGPVYWPLLMGAHSDDRTSTNARACTCSQSHTHMNCQFVAQPCVQWCVFRSSISLVFSHSLCSYWAKMKPNALNVCLVKPGGQRWSYDWR